MTNWPNIQEYRNFEAKFVDISKYNCLIKSPAESEGETVGRNQFKNSISEDSLIESKQGVPEAKTIRCVIKKDFEESFKNFDRGDGVALGNEYVRPKSQETTRVNQTAVDKIRLENHLKWKKQKEEEYYQKKEAEKMARLKKKEEELRMEKIKKQKEIEREEKIREWQEQKSRENEIKKKEKMVMKMLEEEMKEVAPSVDKEKLIEEWVKLKDKQKQMEAEKKAEIQKKEEESRALRQNLAELSYRQWKERIKGRIMTLPKNGYQIFGPKPVPVVKEDWNNDFTNSSLQDDMDLRSTTTSFTYRPAMSEFEDLSKEIFHLEDLKCRSSSFYHLKTPKSSTDLFSANQGPCKAQYKMPLKELQQVVLDTKKKTTKNVQSSDELRKNITGLNLKEKLKINPLPKINGKNLTSSNHFYNNNNQLPDLIYLNPAEGDQNNCLLAPNIRKSSKFFTEFPEDQILPSKKKMNLFINTSFHRDTGGNYSVKSQMKRTPESDSDKLLNETRKDVERKKKSIEAKKNTLSAEKLTRHKSIGSLQKVGKSANKGFIIERGKSVQLESQICRRSKSCDKSVKKVSKDWKKVKQCSSSISMMKLTGGQLDGGCRPPRLERSKTSCCQKKKSKSHSRIFPLETNVKRRLEADGKVKKKLKKKNAFLSKSLSFNDSPYCVKKTITKDVNKVKVNSRKNGKVAEAKSDKASQCRKLSTKT